MYKILIVGLGKIGSQLYDEYKKINPDRYDPAKKFFEKKEGSYDAAFICVDSPMKEDGSCDLSQVKKAIAETQSDIIVLRSTVPPGTTDGLCVEFNKKIVFCPEFYGVTPHSDRNSYNFNFTILGGDKTACEKVAQILQNAYDTRHRFNFTDAKTAELVKYMENTMLATKVSLCVQFWQIAKQLGINYSEMRELLLNDPRINRSHTYVYEDHPYWDSHCFNKDLLAVTKFAYAPLIEDVIKFNEECKQ